MKNSLLALGLLAALPFAASAAENISYNYVEGDYLDVKNSDLPDADGWGVKGSYAFHPNFHAFAGYARKNTDSFGDKDFNLNDWRVGAGYNTEVTNTTDFVARVAYENADILHNGKDFNGFSLEAGLANSFGEHFTAYVMAGYQDYTENDGLNPEGTFYGRLGGLVSYNKNWGVAADIKMDADGNSEWQVGPRFSW